jgi:thioredoxin-related protein
MFRVALFWLLMAFAVSPAFAAEIGEDGLHKEDWFAITFRDIAEDIEAAAAQDKRLVMIFEQRGCSYCREIHEKVLSDPEVRDYINANFMVVQYNMFGDEEVIDTDGETLTEKSAARKWRLLFTPTVMFMPEKAPDGTSAIDAAVAVMPGAFSKGTFLDLFTWVRTKGYETDEPFQKYHARMIEERSAAGTANSD